MYVLAGDSLAPDNVALAGTGTYVRDNTVWASVAGQIEDVSPVPSAKAIKSVTRSDAAQMKVAKIGDTILGRITKINTRFANVVILVINGTSCKDHFAGIIRIQDVREHNKDEVNISKCFRPGDIIRAHITSLGNARSYFLSTNRDDLGVVFAQSAFGLPIVPISWNEMICPKTGVKEFRKCAKPVGDPVI